MSSNLVFPGEHLQHDDDQQPEGGRAERDAVVGDLLHLLRLRRALRVRHHPAADEGQDLPQARHPAPEGRDLQDGHGRPHRVPHRFPNIEHRVLGSISPVKERLDIY